MTLMDHFDVIVIGAGPGGSDLALSLAQAGQSVALVEKDLPGGTCLNRGCIPTKALLHLAEVQENLETLLTEELSKETTILDQRRTLAGEKALAFRDKVVATQRKGLETQLKRTKNLTVFHDLGRISQAHEVRLEESGRLLTGDSIVIATGSVPSLPPIAGADSDGVYTSDAFLDERADRKVWDFSKITIIGGGVIGAEMADYFHSIGKDVLILEALDSLVPNLDKALGRGLSQAFKKKGIKVETGARVEEILKRSTGGLGVAYKSSKTDEALVAESDIVLIATGRKANTEGLLDETVGVETDRGRIVTDRFFRSTVASIYAIGDSRLGSMLLAHEASLDAKRLTEILLRKDDTDLAQVPVVPSCVYTTPELAQVGLTEEACKARGISCFTAKATTTANARNLILGGERGFINLVCDPERQVLLGAQLMGPRATDMVDTLALAINEEISLDRLDAQCHAHPSFSESLGMAVRAAIEKLKY
jgi:dihydrolipoamide dehydrogenase